MNYRLSGQTKFGLTPVTRRFRRAFSSFVTKRGRNFVVLSELVSKIQKENATSERYATFSNEYRSKVSMLNFISVLCFAYSLYTFL